MQLITFLGTADHKDKAHYTWQGKSYATSYVAEALCEFFQPDSVAVFVTKEAKEKNWAGLSSCLNNRFSAQDILIPSGKSETEVWQIFDAVVDAVEPGSQVMFDITHAFRSIPLLVLLAGAFLQKARNVEIKGVYYGAFDVNRSEPPIFDLTPAIKLLDWLTATDKFIDTGSSAEFGKLISTIPQDFSFQQPGVKPTTLKKFVKTIEEISLALDYVRPMGLLKEAAKLEKIPAEKLQTEVGAFAKPFELLLEQIKQDYGQFALADSSTSDRKTELKQHFLLLRWYVDKGFGDRAIVLAREWIVSVLCVSQNLDYIEKDNRKLIENQLYSMSNRKDHKVAYEAITDYAAPSSITEVVTDVEKLGKFWSKLTERRNDLAHAEMRNGSLSASTLEKYVKSELMQGITALFPDMVG